MKYVPDEKERKMIVDRLKRLLLKIQIQMEDKSKEEKGMTTIEYAMMVMFIACVAVLGFELLGGSTKSLYEIANTLLPFAK